MSGGQKKFFWFHQAIALFLALTAGGLVLTTMMALTSWIWAYPSDPPENLSVQIWEHFAGAIGPYVLVSFVLGGIPTLVAGILLLNNKLFELRDFALAGFLVALILAVFITIAGLGPFIIVALLPILASGVSGGCTAWTYLYMVHGISTKRANSTLHLR